MSSVRLPGKVLREAGGKPMLAYLLERLAHGLPGTPVIVVTSVEPSDDPVAQFCAQSQTRCLRGPLDDVAARFLAALEDTRADGFVRISGDSPLLDPALIGQALDLFVGTGADLATNVLERTYPKGMSVEVVRADAFRRAYGAMQESDEFEHVTAHFYRHPANWKISGFTSGRDLGSTNLSVDTEEDFARLEHVLSRMSRPHWTYGMDAVLDLADTAATVPA